MKSFVGLLNQQVGQEKGFILYERGMEKWSPDRGEAIFV
jgi:hypothetical protein